MQELFLSKYTIEAEKLLKEAKSKFRELKLAAASLPENMQPDDGAIKLVFVGQYSAGKSSIIKMLSGIETGIGAGITTQESHVYQWNDLEIIDTPGIQTGLRPDHDEITYGQISQAALLVFVVTNEGFDRQMGEHFRKLALEQNRGNNMVLVINKMDRAPEGNSPAQQKIIRDDICKVLQPLTPEDLYVSFVSTQSYDEYLLEEDEEIKEELLKESGREQLIHNLNDFVAAKEITAKIERPLYTLYDAVQQAAGTPDEQDFMDGTEELLKRKYRIIENSKLDTEQDIQSFAMDCQQNIISLGNEAAGALELGITKEDYEAKLASLQKQAEAEAVKCSEKINRAFTKMANKIQTEIERELAAPYAKKIFQMNNLPVAVPENSGENNGSLGSGLQKAGDVLKNNAMTPGTNLSGWELCNASLKNFSGSFLHTKILDVGKFFGVKFKPWEAVGLAKNLAVLGTVLNVIGIVYTIYSKLQSEDERKEQERKLQEAKDGIRNQFAEWANTIYADNMKNTREQMANIVEPELASLTHSLDNIQEQRHLQEQRATCLNGLLEKIQQLQENIGNNATA